MVWHFRLEGEALDLRAIRELFCDEVTFFQDDNGLLYIVMEFAFGREDSVAARAAADELIAKLNGIAQVVHGDHEIVRLGIMGCKDPSGPPMDLFLQVGDRIRFRSRVELAKLDVTNADAEPLSPPPQKVIGDIYLDAASRDDNFDRALYLLGSLPLDWRSLYMVLEAAEDAHGGERGLVDKNYVPVGQIKRFKDTANSFKAIRLAARHGSTKTGSDKPKIELDEARTMVRSILEQWAKTIIT